ncbi:MAG: DNA mismatch repair protein MutL, partial [Oscillospiraceae bacterium]|nr:DNA mismatch repair protein MutL [Oscillospiraceae bacterium]
FFVNGRCIKSALLQAAVEQAYKNTLLTGRYPACVLYLDLSCASVDVNVHPAKMEVKFSFERKVFDLVYNAVRLSLQSEDRTAEVTLSPSTRKAAAPRADFYQSMSAETFRANGYSVGKASPAPAAPKASAAAVFHSPALVYESDRPSQLRMDLPRPSSPVFPDKRPVSTGMSHDSAPAPVEKTVQTVENVPIPDHKILGEAMNTYILVEVGDSLMLIDKHAAHERMNFDRLKAIDRTIMSQTLLAPVTVKLDTGDAERLEENGALLAELGFEIEPFGEADYVIRGVPADIAPGDAAAALEEICEKLRRGKAPDAQSARDEILHTVACKAAIKAGWDTSPQERQRIVDAVLSGQVKYCPHGRPVSITLSRRDLDKQFKRIV